MKSKIVSLLVLFSIPMFGQSLSQEAEKYFQEQNTAFIEEIESYLDDGVSTFNSDERRRMQFLVDAVTHTPFLYHKRLKNFYKTRFIDVLESISTTKVEEGVVIWNIYNMSYVVKTPKITIAFDLIRIPEVLCEKEDKEMRTNLAIDLAELCDVLFVSHIHSDHADPFVASEFILNNKPVVAPVGVFKDQDFYQKILRLSADGKENSLKINNLEDEINVQIYPGHQAISVDEAINNNFTVLTFKDSISIAHTGDQSWNEDFKWIDNLHKEVTVDVLLVNTWTASPQRISNGVKPKVILPGHINEMSHKISGRIPYWKSYNLWKDVDSKVIYLFIGEPFHFSKN